jgi:sigma-54 dependent transcriptional regulator, acetoin dehydrogenase operon transcriptional activator AcoR
MSPDSASLAVAPMCGPDAWRRTLEVRDRFLAAADPDWLPPRSCGVRREIVLLWRLLLLSGVDAAATDLPRDESAVPPDRLVRAAQPVFDRLADQIAGTQAWAFLADRECRLVRYVAGDPALIPLLEARGAFPGARFGEDVVGTNGLGTAVEQGRPFIVAGSEHFRAYESKATTAGALVRDPVTRRLVGLVNINCRYELTNGLLLPFVTELARSVEERLLAQRPAAAQELLEEVMRVSERSAQAAVALSEEIFIANAAALALLDGADYELLRQWARESWAGELKRERTGRLRLGPDRAVTARCRPLPGTAGRRAAVVTLTPCANAVTAAAPAPQSSSSEHLLARLDQVRVRRLPVLLRGERGTGKATLARHLHARDPDAGPLTVLDAADRTQPPREWIAQLRGALADPASTVVLLHLDALDEALAEPTASLLTSPRARLVATLTERPELTERPQLTDHFPVVLDVPPLRERVGDIPALVTEIIAELHPRPPRPRCTPEALAALRGGEWPGNIRRLRQVVTTALVHSLSGDITVDDLPEGFASGCGRRLTGLEWHERQALVTALRNAAGEREAAARDLGISRATIYRKLKRHGIRPPAAQREAHRRQR